MATVSNRPVSPAWYAFSDYLAAILVWFILYINRNQHLGLPTIDNGILVLNKGFLLGLILLPFGWVLLHWLLGAYTPLYKKSRLTEFISTVVASSIGCTVVFFLVLLNDDNKSLTYYYTIFISFLLLQIIITYIGRWAILQHTRKQLQNGKIKFQAVLLGKMNAALFFFKPASLQLNKKGYRFVGYLSDEPSPKAPLPYLGNLTSLALCLQQHQVDMVIIAADNDHETERYLQLLSTTDIEIKAIPSSYSIVSGAVRTGDVYSPILTDLLSGSMPAWQQQIKRCCDIVFAIIGLVVLSPILLYVAIRVRRSSAGPVLFKQERIGYKGRPFTMYKFRSMVNHAEQNGPALSSDYDPRITPFGRIMRKWRLDELPQLWNILNGDMSLVGPRAERRHYIDQIVQKNPYFNYLLRVKPGLTSWGMVKFGYAQNIDEMIERMKYDLLYLENLSLLLDIRIMFHTIRIILAGKGK